MRFAPGREQLDFAASLRELLAAADVPTVARAWASGDPAPGRALWGKLAAAGVTALAVPEAHGGFGASSVDLVLACVELGRAAVPGPYVESVAAVPALLAGTPAADQLAAVATGATMATVAWTPHVPRALDGAEADLVLCVTADGQLHHAELGTSVRSVDATRRLINVTAGAAIGAAADPGRAFDLATLATAAQLLGAGRAVLDRATSYATQRVQFGRPIGSFQAVKHQLADALVALELAQPLLMGAALAVDGANTRRARDVSAAKVAATDAAYLASRTSLQVHGAIGYTAEYDLAIWLTKIRALYSAWGTQAMHRARVLSALRAAR
jgi:hypothetical protein